MQPQRQRVGELQVSWLQGAARSDWRCKYLHLGTKYGSWTIDFVAPSLSRAAARDSPVWLRPNSGSSSSSDAGHTALSRCPQTPSVRPGELQRPKPRQSPNPRRRSSPLLGTRSDAVEATLHGRVDGSKASSTNGQDSRGKQLHTNAPRPQSRPRPRPGPGSASALPIPTVRRPARNI